jgi:hypothetical protein
MCSRGGGDEFIILRPIAERVAIRLGVKIQEI